MRASLNRRDESCRADLKEMFYHRSHRAITEFTPSQEEIFLADSLRRHVVTLAQERNFSKPEALVRAREYIREVWEEDGRQVGAQEYQAAGQPFANLWIETPGSVEPDSVLVVGAHYDSVVGTPGADDNASAVAALLALSQRLVSGDPPECTVRFVAFANEEPPFFMTAEMGSLVYAESCRRRGDRIEGMVCLEMLGYYSTQPGSQLETLGLLPDRGDFIALVGNVESTDLVKKAASAFSHTVDFPMEAAAPDPSEIHYAAFSDHWSFWQCGWPAFMVTDTGPLRNPHYHAPTDLPETLDYERMARVVLGVEGVIRGLSAGG